MIKAANQINNSQTIYFLGGKYYDQSNNIHKKVLLRTYKNAGRMSREHRQ